MKLSIVIRTLNESRHLNELIEAVGRQEIGGHTCEVVVVDSGSTDGTIDIARRHGCRLVFIRKEDFSFGRSLNVGCDAAEGDVLVFTSGHCIPVDDQWLSRLVAPLGQNDIAYSYGRQIGGETTHFSERQIFLKYFPGESKIPQEGFYCNNANSAILREVWSKYRFDEDLTGLEDMHLAKQLVHRQLKIAYVADAPVFHLHSESWRQVKRRFEREAIALQRIMPEVHVDFLDIARYAASAVLLDWGAALQEGKFGRTLTDVVVYRLCQFWGVFRGNHMHRMMSHATKERYFYPR
jgi:glycosyltransferase involved in cell wall biosynthesis